jgi:hypothetical protein
MKTSPFTAVEFRLCNICCIVTNTEWNGIIKLIIEVKCIRIILSPNLILQTAQSGTNVMIHYYLNKPHYLTLKVI